ncbi:PilN domain-containing protein [bacterium]|nr:PilN domain-containing protein [bacterium]
MDEHSIDLLPNEYRQRKSIRHILALWTTLALFATFVMLSAAGLIRWQADKQEKALETMREQASEIQKWTEEAETISQEIETAVQDQKMARALLREPSWSTLLSDISLAVGSRLWLSDLDIRSEKGKNPTMDESETEKATISLTGAATSNKEVVAFMERLRRSPHLADLDLRVSKMPRLSSDKPIVEFQIIGNIALGELP